MATTTNTTTATLDEYAGDCPECGGHTHTDGTEDVCQRCGLVVDTDALVREPEYRSFADDDRDPRHYAPGNPNRADRGLGTDLQGDTSGPAAGRRHTIHNRAAAGSHADRNRDYATSEIRRVGVAAGLPRPLIARGQHLFRVVHAEGVEGYDLDVLAAASLLAACRDAQAGRTADDLEAAARADARQIRRRLLFVADRAGVLLRPPSVHARIRVVGGRLGVGFDVVREAVAIAPDEPAGNSPSGVAAAALWTVADATQERVCEVAGCTPATLRNRTDALE